MFEQIVHRVVQTGKAHSWLKPFALLALLALFGGAALAEWTVKQSAGAWQAVGMRKAAFSRRLTACREQWAARRGPSSVKPFRPSHRPASRAAAAALAACMVFTLTPSVAFAAQAPDGLCEHHPAHTAECGYAEAVQGAPCTHEHTADCYTGELVCGLEEGAVVDSGEPHAHTQDCYAMDCPHDRGEHDESCGYIAAVEGAPCGNVCTECGQPVDRGNSGNGIETVTLVAFDGLDEAVGRQSVPAGTPLEELALPGTLSATAQTGEEEPEPVTVQGVIWEPDVLYEGEAGSYDFTASATGYTCADGVDWPVITVTVEETAPVPDGIDALCAAIDALPTVEELYENAPGDAEPEFDAWVTETSAMLAEVPALWAQLLALSEDADAMERVTEERTEKLAGLNSLAERLGEAEALDTTVAYIGNTPYNTLADAFAAASSTDPQNPTVIELAKNLTFGSDGDVTAGITVPSGKSVKLTSKDGNAFTISRKAANETKDYFFKVYDSCTLILENVVLDGNNLTTSGEHYFAVVAGAELILENDAKLINNTSPTIRAGTANYTNTVSAITMNGGEISGNSAGGIQMLPNLISQSGKTLRFTMNGGTIKNNTKSSSGAGIYGSNSYSGSGCTTEVIIHNGEITGNSSNVTSTDTVTGGGGVYCDSVFRMDGGTISGNAANRMGGGIYLSSDVSEASITGGTISNNAASGLADTKKGKGNNLYVNKTQNLALSPTENIDGIFLYLGASLKIPSALTHTITLEGAYQRNTETMGLLVASGTSNYTITAADLAKFSYEGNAFGFALDGNQIKLANPSYPVTFQLTGMQGHANSTPLPASIEKGKDLTVQLVASSSYKLPAASVTIKVGGVALAANEYQLQNYSSACSIAIGQAKITGAVEITAKAQAKGSDATLSALTYWYASTPGNVAVPGFSSDAQNPTYNVVLPASVAKNATIYVDKTKSDSNATNSTDPSPITLTDGKGTWSVTITSEDGAKTNTYTVNFTTASAPQQSDAKQITAFTISNQVGQTVINQNNHTIAVTMPSGTNVSSLTPTITVSDKASVSPQSGAAKDFTNPVTYTVTAEDNSTQTYTVTVKVHSAATAPSITTTSLPNGAVGEPYSQTLAASGTVPITWSVESGNLPTGLTLNGNGSITGTPSVANTFTFAVRATNEAGNATKELSITIDEAGTPDPTVTGVIVSPSTATVKKGTTHQFSAVVTGENDPAQDVTWIIEGDHASGTAITGGLLTVASDETAATLTVKATSDADSSKSATAIVTVTDEDMIRYTLTVTGGSGSGDYAENTEITVIAETKANKRFKEWTATGITLADATANPATITMPAGAVTLTATYDDLYAVTASSGGNGTATASPNTAAAGDTVTITASANGGYRFKQWQIVSGGVSLADANAATTTFTMPGTAVEVKAIFEAATTPPTNYTVTLQNGGSGASGSGSYAQGAIVTISAGSNSGYSFSGWIVVGGGITLANRYQSTTTFAMPAENVTVQANWSRNSSGGGGSGDDDSSGSGSGSSTPPTIVTPPEAKPDTPVTAHTEIKAQSDGKGGAQVTVPKNAVDSAIQKAQEEARRNGTQDNGVAVQINVAANSQNVNSLTVNLPKVTQEQIIDNRVQTFALALERPDITLSLSLESVQEINWQANADVQLTATRLTDTSKLSDETKAVVGSRPLFQLTATYKGGANTITDFGNGSVTVAIPYKLQAGESAGGLYLVYIDGQGKPQFITNSSYDAENEVLRGATNHFSLYAVGYKAPDAFSDIVKHWAKEDIEFVAARGLMAGVGNGRFNPDGTMTRAMFVTALGRLAGVDPADYKSGTFTDVKADAYYAPYVEWAEKTGVVTGIGGGLFAPDRNVTRQEMAVIMANYAKAMGYKVPVSREALAFTDNTSIASWAAESVKAMQQAGVLMGKDAGRFDPLGNATRAQAAAVLHRYMELIIDRQTAQGLDINDSGSAMLWENGRLVRSASRTVGAATYNFNRFGEAALPVGDKKYRTHIVKKNEYFWSISRLYGCTMQEVMALNGLKMGDVIHPGDVLRVPAK